MSGRAEEHRAWNEARGLHAGDVLSLVCPVCATIHEETLTNDPNQPDYLHHVHQCTNPECGVRFDLFVRCRADGRDLLSGRGA